MDFREYIFYNQLRIKDVAKELDLAPSYLSQMLHGHTRWSSKTARAVERYTKGMIKAQELSGKTYTKELPKEKLYERI